MVISKNLKKLLVSSMALIMLSSIGASASQITVNAKHVRTHRTIHLRHHSRKALRRYVHLRNVHKYNIKKLHHRRDVKRYYKQRKHHYNRNHHQRHQLRKHYQHKTSKIKSLTSTTPNISKNYKLGYKYGHKYVQQGYSGNINIPLLSQYSIQVLKDPSFAKGAAKGFNTNPYSCATPQNVQSDLAIYMSRIINYAQNHNKPLYVDGFNDGSQLHVDENNFNNNDYQMGWLDGCNDGGAVNNNGTLNKSEALNGAKYALQNGSQGYYDSENDWVPGGDENTPLSAQGITIYSNGKPVLPSNTNNPSNS